MDGAVRLGLQEGYKRSVPADKGNGGGVKLETGSEEKGAEKVTSFRTKKILSAGDLQAAGRDVMSERSAFFGKASFPEEEYLIVTPC